MISEQERALNEHLSTQRVIIKVIVKRISYLRFFINNYSTPNNFLLNAMSAIRTNIIIDLSKLYIIPNYKGKGLKKKYKHYKENNNFYYVLNKYLGDFDICYQQVNLLLDSVKKEVEWLIEERDTSLVHIDTSTGELYKVYSKDKFEILEKLTDTAVEIFKLLQKDIRGGNPSYDESVDSLKEVMNLVKKSKEERDKKYIKQAFKHKKRAKD
ncbi:hypothetical protein AB9K24_04295 [Meridianimaribacter flavus]